jgi:hypothetical protein
MKVSSKKRKITRQARKRFFMRIIPIALFLAGASPAAHALDQNPWWKRVRTPEPVEVIVTTVNLGGQPLDMVFEKGPRHNHPLMAIWVEDLQGKYIQTLYVAQSIAKGVYLHGDPSTGRWLPGPVRRPATLPYWSHKRGIQAEDGLFIPSQAHPMADALTGPTPKGNFVLQTQVPELSPRKFRVLMEINQPWDWNQHWYNARFPGDREYMTSAQPALVYEALIDLDSGTSEIEMKAIGHSHWSGRNGELFKDLSTLTTALNISERVYIKIPEKK